MRSGKKRHAVFVGLFTLLLAATAIASDPPPPPKTLPAVHQETPLVVGLLESAPYMMRAKDGTWSGLAVEMWKVVAAELHLP
jgi:ABC-type amino acid transport substrate-binding protein